MTLLRNSLSGLQATKSNWTTAFVHEWHVDWPSDYHTMMLTTSLMNWFCQMHAWGDYILYVHHSNQPIHC